MRRIASMTRIETLQALTVLREGLDGTMRLYEKADEADLLTLTLEDLAKIMAWYAELRIEAAAKVQAATLQQVKQIMAPRLTRCDICTTPARCVWRGQCMNKGA